MRKFLLSVLIVCLMATPLLATTAADTSVPGLIVLTVLDTDWSGATAFPDGIKITAVKMWPSATDDYFMLRAGSVTGPKFCFQKSTDGGVTKEPFWTNVRWIPCLEIDDCNFDTAASVIIVIEYEP
jgi:hypothetical protein